MNVLLINGSPRADGCTFTALSEISKKLNENGIQTEILQVGNVPVQDCIACGKCKATGKCVFDDVVNVIIEKAKTADGFVFGTPVYYAHPTGRILSVLDRAFYAGGANFVHKPAAVIASARRAGTTVSLDTLSKYLGIKQMPISVRRTGIWFTAALPNKFIVTQRVCRQCATLRQIWRGYSNVSTRVQKQV